jgi:hypothetical protein
VGASSLLIRRGWRKAVATTHNWTKTGLQILAKARLAAPRPIVIKVGNRLEAEAGRGLLIGGLQGAGYRLGSRGQGHSIRFFDLPVWNIVNVWLNIWLTVWR